MESDLQHTSFVSEKSLRMLAMRMYFTVQLNTLMHGSANHAGGTTNTLSCTNTALKEAGAYRSEPQDLARIEKWWMREGASNPSQE